jgi:hypothetical protein
MLNCGILNLSTFRLTRTFSPNNDDDEDDDDDDD